MLATKISSQFPTGNSSSLILDLVDCTIVRKSMTEHNFESSKCLSDWIPLTNHHSTNDFISHVTYTAVAIGRIRPMNTLIEDLLVIDPIIHHCTVVAWVTRRTRATVEIHTNFQRHFYQLQNISCSLSR